MRRFSKYWPLVFALVMTGCDGKDEPAKAGAAEHVFSDQTGAVDKARDVERLIQETADRQRDVIDEQDD